MSFAVLATSYHPSNMALIVAGLTAVIASGVRPFFRWLEFHAFISMWRELARRDSGMTFHYFSEAMSAFRYRGKVASRQLMIDPDEPPFSAQRKGLRLEKDASTHLAGRSRDSVNAGTDGTCPQVTSRGDEIFIVDSKNPDGTVITCSTADWKMFLEGLQKGDPEGPIE